MPTAYQLLDEGELQQITDNVSLVSDDPNLDTSWMFIHHHGLHNMDLPEGITLRVVDHTVTNPYGDNSTKGYAVRLKINEVDVDLGEWEDVFEHDNVWAIVAGNTNIPGQWIFWDNDDDDGNDNDIGGWEDSGEDEQGEGDDLPNQLADLDHDEVD